MFTIKILQTLSFKNSEVGWAMVFLNILLKLLGTVKNIIPTWSMGVIIKMDN